MMYNSSWPRRIRVEQDWQLAVIQRLYHSIATVLELLPPELVRGMIVGVIITVPMTGVGALVLIPELDVAVPPP